MKKSTKKVEKQDRRIRRRMLILLSAVLMITAGSVIFGVSFSDAHGNSIEEPVNYEYYKSIVIEKGDTLWDIALRYKTDAYESTQEYIDELKRINSLTSDHIEEGKHLMVVYYDDIFHQ